MKYLFDILKNEPDYARMLKAFGEGRLPLAASGMSWVHKALITACLVTHTGKKAVLITPDEQSATALTADLEGFGLTVLQFTSRDYNTERVTGYSKEYEHKRIDTLSLIHI